MKKQFNLSFLQLIFFFIFITSCTTSKNTTKTNENDFYNNFIKNTTTKELSNGIKVILNNNTNAKVNTVMFYFKTGSSSLPIEKAGTSYLALTMMNNSSKHFSEENKQRLINKTLTKINFSANSVMSTLSITSLTKYFNQVFPIIKDSILNPDFSNFKEIQKKQKFELSNTLKTDLHLLNMLSEKDLKYKTNFIGKNKPSKENIDLITEEDLIDFHKNLFTENSIYILCAGNFDKKLFLKDLEKSFGKIKLIKNKSENKVFDYKFSSSIIDFNQKNNSKLEYAKGYINFPDDIDKYYASTKLLTLIYRDLLNNIVREKYGSCYSTTMFETLCNNPFLTTLGYRISNKTDFFNGINEAKELLKSKKIISGKLNDSSQDFLYVPIEEKLENYKNQLINTVYANAATSEGKIYLMEIGLILNKNPDFMFQLENKINQVTKENLYECIDIVISNEEQWYYLTGVK